MAPRHQQPGRTDGRAGPVPGHGTPARRKTCYPLRQPVRHQLGDQMDAGLEAQGLAQGRRQAGAERGAAQGDRPGARRAASTPSNGCGATRGTTSTRRPTNAPGPRPRRTSKVLPSGRAPGFGPAPAGRQRVRARPRPAARAASTAARTLRGAACGHGQQELFGARGLDEPDLFSELEEEPVPARRAEASPEAIVESLERELLRPETRADLGRTGVLLHPDFTEIGSSGRIWTRDAMMMALEDNPGGPTELELLGADRLGEEHHPPDLPQPHPRGHQPCAAPCGSLTARNGGSASTRARPRPERPRAGRSREALRRCPVRPARSWRPRSSAQG